MVRQLRRLSAEIMTKLRVLFFSVTADYEKRILSLQRSLEEETQMCQTLSAEFEKVRNLNEDLEKIRSVQHMYFERYYY